MVEIKRIYNKSDIKKFVQFGIDLYSGCKNFVPPLFQDEVNMFIPEKNACCLDTDVQCFLAYRDGKIVGRIAGLIQKTFNKINNEKRVRFTRFDCIDDQEVANALFDAVEKWAKEQGLNQIHGPLGFNDLDKEGLLVEGFNELSTFETQYSYEYYGKLVENYGFKKDTDWLEFLIKVPEKADERYERVSNLIMRKYKLKNIEEKDKNKFIDTYYKQIFDLIDESYKELYGVVPFGEEVRKQYIKSFKLILNMRYVAAVQDENGKVVAFGLTFPSIAEPVRDSKGKLLPFGVFRLLKALKKPKVMDMALIAVAKDYRNKGLPALIFNKILNNYIEDGIEYVESNPELETNEEVQAQWKPFEHRQHKRRRCYIKNID